MSVIPEAFPGSLPYKRSCTIALAGNPNVGKSTVFNALTGLHQHTGNWAGKTVENAEGQLRIGDCTITLADLPGVYSLTPRSAEERAAREYLLSGRADAVIVVCDATALSRGIHLVLQILELTNRCVVCCNLMDEAEYRGIHVDCPALAAVLGVPVIPADARRGRGLPALIEAALTAAFADSAPPITPFWESTPTGRVKCARELCRNCVRQEDRGEAWRRRLDRLLTGRLTASEDAGTGHGVAIKRTKVAEVGWDADDLDYSITLENGIGSMTAYSYTGSTSYTALDVYFYVGEGGKPYAAPTYIDAPGDIPQIGIWGAPTTKHYWEETTDTDGRSCKTIYLWLSDDTPNDTVVDVEFLTSKAIYAGWKNKGTDVHRPGLSVALTNGSGTLTFCCANTYYTLHIRNYINLAPERKLAAGTGTVAAGQEYVLDLSTVFHDQNGDSLTYYVDVDGGDPISVDTQCAITPTEVGTMVLVFTASDGTAVSQPYTLTLTVTDGSFTVGDVNGDGIINLKDSSALLRYLVGWDEPVVLDAADTNGDGLVNNKDATHLMRYLADWDVTLG